MEEGGMIMFEDALKLILAFEGGFSDDPNDPGGRTNFGITQNTYDPTRQKDVKNITQDEVSKIYQNSYWRDSRCDAINTVSPNLATIHFDCAVNCGVGRAIRLLQGVLGVTTDGIIGPDTLSKIDDSRELKTSYLARRKLYYDSLIQARPNLAQYRSSWYHRLNTLATKSGLSYHT